VADTLIEHARERRASLILVGRSRQRLRRRWRFGRGLAERLLSLGEGLEISVLDTEAERAQGSSRARAALQWRDYLLAPLAAVLASGLALGLSRLLELPNISLIFLAAVLVVAVRSSLGPALLCAGLSFLAYNLLFIEPLLSRSMMAASWRGMRGSYTSTAG
jgi:two-component system sensor histidine kinase KdpD